MPVQSRTLVLALAPFRRGAFIVGPLAMRRRVFPEEVITVASSPGVCEVVRALRLASDVWKASALDRPADVPATAFGGLSLLSKAKSGRFDKVIDLFPGVASGIVSFVSGGGRGGDPMAYVEAILAKSARKRAPVDPLLRLSQQLGVGDEASSIEIVPNADSDTWVERALASIGYKGGGAIVAVHSSGSWPADRFVDVASRLRSQFNAWVVALDTPAEGHFAKRFAGAVGGSVLGMGSPSGERFLAALARSSIVLTDDAGVANLASLARVRTVFVEIGVPSIVPQRRVMEVCGGPTADAVSAEAVHDAACSLMGRDRTSTLFDA